jgi:protein involved in polysaccharide export with SLBB domain
MTKYVINPTVSVRLANFKVTVLGEEQTGRLYNSKWKGTILNALGMAGDLTSYGKREDVLVIRTENGVVSMDVLILEMLISLILLTIILSKAMLLLFLQIILKMF